MTRLLWFTLAALLLAGSPASADDYFLTIGGGYSPAGNQVSLEKNVLLFRQLVEEQYPAGVRHDVFFSDGKDAGRDLQWENAKLEIPPAQLLLAQVFRQTKYLRNQYRSHQIDNVRGATSRASLQQWFDEVGSKLQPGDRLFVYVTAHGGRSTDKQAPHNTRLYLWNSQQLPMNDWVGYLDKISPEVAVVTVMVQCYGGGFANIVFNEGSQSKGYTQANRCGFFATTHLRPAAGCTPDIDEENYREYSTYFWEAIRGKTRSGQPVPRPDYDGDGQVSFAEAHAHALLTSTSVDISIKTSDAFLRAYSRTEAKAAQRSRSGDGKKPETSSTDPTGENQPGDTSQPELLTPDSPFELLAELASPADRAVLLGLSQHLELSQPQRAKEAAAKAAQLMKEKKELDAALAKKSASYNRATGNIQRMLTHRWPELNNRWHPGVNQLLAEQSADLVQAVETHPDFAGLEDLRQAQEELKTQKMDLDRRWARCQRLIHTLENVALAANLPQLAPQDVQDRYAALVAAESGRFGPANP